MKVHHKEKANRASPVFGIKKDTYGLYSKHYKNTMTSEIFYGFINCISQNLTIVSYNFI